MTETVRSSGCGGTAAAMAQNERRKSIPRSSSSHREGSITQRGASCGSLLRTATFGWFGKLYPTRISLIVK